jgi:hypothetical protein
MQKVAAAVTAVTVAVVIMAVADITAADITAVIMVDGMADGMEDGAVITGELVIGDLHIMTMDIDTKITLTAIISRPLMVTGTILATLITIIHIN